MRRTKAPKKKNPVGFNFQDALASMNAEELRELAHDMFLELDSRAHNRVLHSLMERAARSATGPLLDGPTRESIAKILSFAERATQKAYADPEDMDEYLGEGSKAFLSKDYTGAAEIFRALLLPISVGDIYLGQDEMVDEVLTVDVSTCAAQYVVATYMITEKENRAPAMKETMQEVYYEGHFWRPLEVIERTSVESLPDFERFLTDWRKLLEKDIEEGNRYQNDDQYGWLREVVQRMEGAGGLAKVARESKRSDDLRAWCEMLVNAGDWNSAFSAYKEAAEIVTDKEYARADFLDGVALAAQELGKKNISAHLERAWRQEPTLLRLIRWLGTSKSKTTINERAKQALKACPPKAHRQAAFLHLILSDFRASGKLLGNAKGLGWSDSDHPGHLIFPLFYKLLGGSDAVFESGYTVVSTRAMTIDDLEFMTSRDDEPTLVTPSIDEILALVGMAKKTSETSKNTMLLAMKKAAENRIAGVTGKGRRKYYSHGAQLVAACFKVDPSEEAERWVTDLRQEYRRYPALQAEFSNVLE